MARAISHDWVFLHMPQSSAFWWNDRYYLEAIPCTPDDVFGPEAIPADKEPDHNDCQNGCMCSQDVGASPNRVCEKGKCQLNQSKPAKRREFSVYRTNPATFGMKAMGPIIGFPDPITVREVLPGDPSTEQVEELVDAANEFAFGIETRERLKRLQSALAPFQH